MKIGLYAGSFNPFTIGHWHIVEKASKLFDKIFIAKLSNSEKEFGDLLQEKNVSINGCAVEFVNCNAMLLVELCKNLDVNFIVRGIRNNKDYEYEKELFLANKILDTDIETIYFFADAEFEGISASLVKELKKYGKDYSKYIK